MNAAVNPTPQPQRPLQPPPATDPGLDAPQPEPGRVTLEDLERARIAAVSARPQQSSQRRLLRREPPPSPLARGGAGSEQIHVLRTELLLRHDRRVQGANIVTVVSPGPGEGRSQLAAELARSFSRTGQSTLLIDADLRRPSQHQRFAQANNPGLVEAIVDGRSPQFCSLDNAGLLFLLPAGGPTDSAAELLSSRSFEALLDGWAHQFDHIVIDTPPANDYPDALALGTIARRALLVSRAQRTSLSASREMMRRLQATRVEILGAVVCHF